ncbi:MAG TPA: DegV family protein [Solimonas sp.]|nr:DegV family protein [Solimonas sp.]
MRIGIVVDSGCDLPREFIDQNKIEILPVTIHLQGGDFVDVRDPAATLDFYDKHAGSAGDSGTSPFSTAQIKNLFLERMVGVYDFVFCLTIASSRSPIFENATQASLQILNEYKPYRAKAGLPGPFALRVVDTQNLFAAQGVIAIEAVRQIKLGQTNPNKIRERLEFLVQNLYAYMIPRDLHYLRSRAQKKGDRSVGWAAATFGSLLDIKPVLRCHRNETAPVGKVRHFDQGAEKLLANVTNRVKAGLLTPTLCFSYGGEISQMRKLPGYDKVQRACKAAKVEIHESVMSVTGGVNVGEGAFAVGFAAEPHQLEL